jgi:hypothetical protein
MTYVKIDHPRRIDQFIDYFGESRHTASSDRRPYAVEGRESHHEASYESVMSADALYAPM